MTKKSKMSIIAGAVIIAAVVTVHAFPGTGTAHREDIFRCLALAGHGHGDRAPVVRHGVARFSERLGLSADQEQAVREALCRTAEEIERSKERSADLRELGTLVGTAVRDGIEECRSFLTQDQLAECRALEEELRLKAADHLRENGDERAGHRVRMLTVVLDLSPEQEREIESLFRTSRLGLIEKLETGDGERLLLDHLLAVDDGISRILDAGQRSKYEDLKSVVHDRLTS